jgi:nucleoside-diphosphate kinase
MSSEERFVFIVEWFDTQASIIRKYYLTYYLTDNTIDMYDIKNKRVFLKRCEYAGINLEDMYIGSVLTVYSRQLTISEYADKFTQNSFQKAREKTFGMIKPDAYLNIGRIISAIYRDGFKINKLKMSRFDDMSGSEFYGVHKGKHFFPSLMDFVSSDVCVGMELVKDDAIKGWRSLLGPTNTLKARDEAPESLRAQFGTDGTKNACHGSDAPESADRELNFFFGKDSAMKTNALLNNCTCAIIKPHIIRAGLAGEIIQKILDDGFEISAMEMFHLDTSSAEEFLEVYKGVLPEFLPLVDHLSSGPCIVLEVRQENAVEALRKLCGPHDPEIAKTLRPGTIRAVYGEDRVCNAVHCTDLPEDGVIECEYFFSILQG